MGRKKIEYSEEFPYHCVARCNNKDWFYIPMDEVWLLFTNTLIELSQKYSLRVHGFVLMSNHYHLIISTHSKYNISFIMNRLQTIIAQEINRRSGRINHVFGGTYRPSIIRSPYYFANALKYIYQNPLKANICDDVRDYKYSTINDFLGLSSSRFPLSCHEYEKNIHMELSEPITWLNEGFSDEAYALLQKATRKTEFKFCKKEASKVLTFL